MKFVMENVGAMKSEGKEVTQKIELTDNDPCKFHIPFPAVTIKAKQRMKFMNLPLPILIS